MKDRLWICLLLASLAAGPVHGACGVGGRSVDKVVIGDVRRCESARFHLDAFAEANNLLKMLKDPQSNLHPGLLKGYERTRAGTVVVVSIESHLPITLEWLADGTTAYRPNGQWITLAENVRYWWRGDAGECESAAALGSVRLRVRSPCCDTLPYFGHCLLGMDLAEPLSQDMLTQLGKALENSPRKLSDGGKRSTDEYR